MSLAIDRCRTAWESNGLRWIDTGPGKARAQTPGHGPGDDGMAFMQTGELVVVHCFNGDKWDALAEVGLTDRDLFDNRREAIYRYPGGSKVTRRPGKKFVQNVAEGDRTLYRADDIPADTATTIYVCEGEKDADAGTAAGMTCVSTRQGSQTKPEKWNWSPLAGHPVVVIADRDDTGRAHAERVKTLLTDTAASVTIVEAKTGKDLTDHLLAGHTPAELSKVDREKPAGDPLAELETTFRKWLGADYDLDTAHAVLAAAAVERMNGDPLWLLVLSGSGNAKTETVQALAGAGAHVTSSISGEAALLSATRQKEKAKDATGGLLRSIGASGTLVVKDVTTILSMNRDRRAEVLAALREIYDGNWQRNVGTDGGRTLTWTGRIALIGAVTSAWDRAHSVVSSMGDRFVLIRSDSKQGRVAGGRRAIGNTGDEQAMRAELQTAVGYVLNNIDADAATIRDDDTETLLAAADLVTLARTNVERDFQGDVIDADMPEAPTRFAKQLAQVMRGALAIGLPRREATRLALRCARDSLTPMRLAIIEDIAAHPYSPTNQVRKRINRPRKTVDRELQALHALEVLVQNEDDTGRGTMWRYNLADGIDPKVLKLPANDDEPEKEWPYLFPPEKREKEEEGKTDEKTVYRSLDKSGHTPSPNDPGPLDSGEPEF